VDVRVYSGRDIDATCRIFHMEEHQRRVLQPFVFGYRRSCIVDTARGEFDADFGFAINLF
jgi:hypothetical protein